MTHTRPNAKLSRTSFAAIHATALACAVLISSLAGCTQPSKSSTTSTPIAPPSPGHLRTVANTSGFLKDYSNLLPSPKHAETMYEQSRELGTYQAFIITEIVVLADKTMLGDPLSDQDKRELADALREELNLSLGMSSRIASAPGPKIASIRAAITQVAKSRRDPSGTPKITPRAGGPQIGGASVEAEIIDSITGKRIAAVVENDLVDEEIGVGASTSNGKGVTDPFYDARLVFRHWAARLSLWIQSADDTATK